MSEEIIVKHCSPTLAGMKTGNLFACPYESEKEILEDLRKLNKLLVPKGLRALPMRFSEDRALIYIYRPEKLKKDLAAEAAGRILEKQGYSVSSTDRCVAELMKRLRMSEVFPHEIGLFLGYPPGDVEGFMEKRAAKCVGTWKVYGNEAEAKRTFAKYKKCTRVYCSQLVKGAGLERLCVKG